MLTDVNFLQSRFLRFGVSAALATAAHWGCMWLLINSGARPELATGIGALLGAVTNYLLQYHFAFQSRQPHGVTLVRYVLTCVLGWSANLLVFSLLLWCWDQVALAQFTTTALVAFLNYFVYRRMVFHDRISPCLAD